MILVDRRIGSRELVAPLERLGLPVTETTLEYGDVAFEGRGRDDQPVYIGIERKRVNDLIQSLTSGRLAGHQLVGLQQAYDYCWLLVEGAWRHHRSGAIVEIKGGCARPTHSRMHASTLEKRLLTLQLRGGLFIWQTESLRESARFLQCLYRYWTDASLDEHTSHEAIYHHAESLVRISPTREAFHAWPTIGYRTSAAVEQAFGTLRRAMHATVEEWAAIEIEDRHGGKRRLGIKDAQRICTFLDGGD